jgi:hypothetical protein
MRNVFFICACVTSRRRNTDFAVDDEALVRVCRVALVERAAGPRATGAPCVIGQRHAQADAKQVGPAPEYPHIHGPSLAHPLRMGHWR